ncbi:hypothetical protein FNT36_18430 [Hymenobacter setariae]|uniref:Uncharacterized protein n=1 Tax=Hymenobacter setariae TaxID=2594794 RepID=A0A558BT08_9BACT|nr:hypothetical protein [Hymenobacter setariae]TVT39619.1 hypothetical protein FNT36_18430 [Hymenobacter setariae]
MSYPHLSPETITECSRAAYAYSHDCYCIIYWACADYLPRSQYHGLATKWLCASVFRAGSLEQGDRYVVGVSAETGPELLRYLRTALEDLSSGERPDPSLLATDYAQRMLSTALSHPMLTSYQLLRILHSLLPRLPRHEAQTLTTQLQQAIDQRSREAYIPPQGNGWIALAPQTTEPLPLPSAY